MHEYSYDLEIKEGFSQHVMKTKIIKRFINFTVYIFFEQKFFLNFILK